MDEFVKLTEELRSKMWRTAGARYLAAYRLTRKERFSTFSIAILSVIAIGVGLLDPHVSPGAKEAGVSFAAVTASISVFILAISLIEAGGQTSVRAAKLHENAVRISEARTDLETMLAQSKEAGTPNWAGLDGIRKAYETHLRECPFNHETVDYQRFEAAHRLSPEFLDSSNNARMSWPASQWVKVRHLASAAWLPFASWIVVLALILLVFDWSPLVRATTN